jgi:MFS family permease
MVVGTVCIGAFIGQVDASIIQLAMPSLEDAFDAPLHAVSWAAVGYVLAFASTLPLFARLAVLGAVRPRDESADTHRLPPSPRRWWRDARREQRPARHDGERLSASWRPRRRWD